MNILSSWKDFQAYSSARRLNDGDFLFLDANESPEKKFGLNLYRPCPSFKVRPWVSKILQIPEDHLLVDRGSDAVMDLLFKLLRCQGKIGSFAPSYGMYSILAKTYGLEFCAFGLDLKNQGTVDFSKFRLWLSQEKCDYFFLCRPNNPTGGLLLAKSEIQSLAQEFPNTVFVIDEAYGDFVPEESCIPFVGPNLLILKTLSKAFSLAGLRVGALIAPPEWIGVLEKIQLPYPFDGLTGDFLEKNWERIFEEKNHTVKKICELRPGLLAQLREVAGLPEAFPAYANFLFFLTPRAQEISTSLREKKILIRYFALGPGAIRFSIGTQEQNQKLIEALQ